MPANPVNPAALKIGGLLISLTVLLTGLSTAQPEIHLESGSFTPAENTSQVAGLQSHTAPQSHEEEYMLLQFQGPVTQDERERISEKHGVEFISYIPDYAWITHVSSDKNSIIREEAVRTLRPYKPEHRISTGLQKQKEEETGETTVLVEAFESEGMESMLEEYGSYKHVRGDRWQLETGYSELEGLSREEHVKWISKYISEMETHNAESRELIEVDRLHENPFNLRGRGLTANIRDEGEIGDHDDLTYDDKIILEDEAGVSEHATHVAGTMLGSGNLSTDRELRGMAPDARAISYDFNDLGDLMDEVDHSISEYDTLLSQNSWGADMRVEDEEVMGSYGSLASDYDNISSGEADISGSIPFIFSAGNEGNEWEERYNTTTPPSTAKNTITVGAVDSTGDMTSFSSWGPTDDGRMKPTVVADGASVISTIPGNDYGLSGGTSMAAPAVSGTAILVNEQFNDSYDRMPDPATVKASLIHTAEDLGREGPDYRFGWGLVNATAAVEYVEEASERDLIERGSIQDTGDSETYSVDVPKGESVKFTLVWNDYPGTGSAGKHLVNDLDLVVENGEGERKYPWTLSWENRTEPALQDRPDRTNPVNQVYVENTETTDYTVTVEGHNVPEGEQEYSLLMTSEEPDYSPAELKIESPENTSYSETPDFNLSSDRDLAEGSYSFGETNTTLEEKNSTFFFDTDRELDEGLYDTTFYGEDLHGNISSEEVSFTLDRTPPHIEVFSPENNTIKAGDIELEASFEDNLTGVDTREVSLVNDSGVQKSFKPNTSFDSTEFEDGNYNLIFYANDSAGNENTEELNITLSSDAPEINIISPEQESIQRPPFEASASVSSSTDVSNTLEVFNQDIEVTESFNYSVSVNEFDTGNYSFRFNSTDEAGNKTVETVEAGISNPVNLSIENPENETYGEVPEIEASSNVSMEEAFYSTGEENSTLGSGTSFNEESPILSNGTQTIQVWARDSAGAWFNENVSFTVDTAEPDLEPLRPEENANVSGDIAVEASWNNSFSDIVGSSFNVSGLDGELNESFDSELLEDGEHTVFYNVTDEAGNTALENRSITVDNNPPTVNVSEPEDGAVVAGEFDAEASVNESVTRVEYINTTVENESVVAEGQGNSSFDSEQLEDGNYSLLFTANDSAGNTGSSSVEIRVDNTAPELETVAPDNDKIATPFDVEASWSDESDIDEASFKLVNETGTQVEGGLNGSVTGDDIGSGDYTLNYTVTDEVGNTAFDEQNVEISAGPEPDIAAPQNISYGETPDFNVSTDKELETAFVEAGEENISLGEENSSFYSNRTAELETGRYTAVFNVIDIEGVKDEASVSFTVDKQPPEISDVKPIEDANLSENFTVEASVTDEFSDVEQQRFKVFNSSGPQTDYRALNSTLDISGVEDGEYKLKLEASDELGNEESVNRTVNLDRESPSISFDSVNETVSGDLDIGFSAEDNRTGIEASWMSLVNESGSQFNTTENETLDTEAFADGDYTLKFNAVDRAGNDAVEEEDVEFDNTAPVIDVESPEDEHLSGEVWVNASVNDSNPANTSYRWMENGSEATEFTPVNETFKTSSLDDGKYNLTVKANDTLGNERKLTQEYLIDNTAPDLEIELYNYTELENNWVEPGFTAEAKCSSLSNISEVQASHTGSSTSNSSINTTVDSAGVQHLVFNCTDNAGNEASLNQTEFVDGGAPEVEVTVPEEGSTVETDFELEASTRDETEESGVNSSASFLEISEGTIDNVEFTNTTFTADVSELDHSTSFTVTGNITDYAGLTHEVNLDFTTESDDSSSSGGSGGGGGSGSLLNTPDDSEDESDSNTRTEELSDEGTEIDVSDLETPVRSLEASGTGSASFTVQESDSTGPEQASATYRSMEMTLEAEDIESTTVNFDVEKDWIQENMVKPENVFMYREGSEWEKLETEVTGEEDEAYLYSAEVPEFSTFSIAAEEEQEQETFLVEEDGECVEVEAYEERENMIDNCQEVEAQLQEENEPEEDNEEEQEETEEEKDESVGLMPVLFAAASLAMLSGFGYGYYALSRRKKLKKDLEELKKIIGPDPELQYLLSDAEKAFRERDYDKSSDVVNEIKDKVKENYGEE